MTSVLPGGSSECCLCRHHAHEGLEGDPRGSHQIRIAWLAVCESGNVFTRELDTAVELEPLCDLSLFHDVLIHYFGGDKYTNMCRCCLSQGREEDHTMCCFFHCENLGTRPMTSMSLPTVQIRKLSCAWPSNHHSHCRYVLICLIDLH